MSGEREFLARLRGRLPQPPAGQTWVGDDAAVLEGGLLVATDALVADVHFDLAWCRPEDVGWKALVVNLSDLAAMAGSPSVAVAALVVPPAPAGLADAVMAGTSEAAEAFGCPLVGGDTTGGPALMVAMAVIGHARGGGPVLRRGARPGDGIHVTGALGGASVALRSRRRGRTPETELARRLDRPVPRLAEGSAAGAAGATAMIDVSDGLAVDLGHICDESGVGVRVEASRIPVVGELDDALFGGDDYELCFTAPDEDAVARDFAASGLAPPVRIGTVTEEPERVLVLPGGRARPLPDRGWDHAVP